MKFKSQKYKVASIQPSKARYAKGVSVDDMVQFIIGRLGMTTSTGRRSSAITMLLNEEVHCELNQGDLPYVLGILELKEVAE